MSKRVGLAARPVKRARAEIDSFLGVSCHRYLAHKVYKERDQMTSELVLALAKALGEHGIDGVTSLVANIRTAPATVLDALPAAERRVPNRPATRPARDSNE